MKLFLGSIATGIAVGYLTPAENFQRLKDIYYVKFTVQNDKKMIHDFNRKYKRFAEILPDQTGVPLDIQNRFFDTEHGRLLLNYASSVGIDSAKKPEGMVFMFMGSSNCQGHTNIVHGGLS